MRERKPKAPSQPWFERKAGLPNDAEMLFYALLILTSGRTVGAVKDWAKKVLLEERRMSELGESWSPNSPDWAATAANATPPIYELMGYAYAGTQWSEARLESIGVAMQAWREAGRVDGLDAGKLKAHWPADVRGPPTNKKRPNGGPKRWQTPAAVIGTARLIKGYVDTMRMLLKLDVPLNEVPTVEMELEELKSQKAELELQVPKLITERDHARDAHRQTAKRLKTKNRAVTAARKDEKAKLKEKQEPIVQQKLEIAKQKESARADKEITEAKQAVAADVEKRRVEVNTARAKARKAKTEMVKVARKLQRTERKLQAALQSSEEEQEESEEEMEESEDEAGPTKRLPFELLPRRDERGRWQAEADEVHSMRMAQCARGVAPSTIAANIQDVLAMIAPELEIAATCERQSRMLRGETTLAGEGMAAWKFATSKRIVWFGWDESTKFGDAVFSCHFVIEHYDGTREDICLRGLTILPDGGTSAAVLEHIEKRILSYSRRILTLWMEAHEKLHGAGSWAAAGGPSPDNIGLHRLCEDTVLMTDTCNGARCTKRMLAAAIMATIEEKIGKEAWEAMSTEERNEKYMVYRGDCWQHLRNIIVSAMATKGDELIGDWLAESLEVFSSYERVDPKGGGVIRACFKDFHAGGEYCKGHGREFWVWAAKKYPKALILGFERALGSRQDLGFDGCVALFWNRMMCLDFLRGYIDAPKSSNGNLLDKSLYTMLKCNELTALLRANTLWAYLFSQPWRWLAGKGSKLAGFSLYKMNEIADLVHSSMQEIAADPSRLLHPNFDMWASLTETVPEFAVWRTHRMGETKRAADGTKHYVHRAVLDEARSPADPKGGNAQATPRTLELIKAMALRALEKMEDPKLAIAVR